jgi:hypothetical protein
MRPRLSKNSGGENGKHLWPRGKAWQIAGHVYFWQKFETLEESIVFIPMYNKVGGSENYKRLWL